MRPILVLVRVLLCAAATAAWAAHTAADELPACRVRPPLIESLRAPDGVSLNGYVTSDGVHHAIRRGRAWMVGSDSLEFARDHARVLNRPGASEDRADGRWRVPLERVSYLLPSRGSHPVSPRKIGSGERVCAYVTSDGQYRSVEGMRAYQLPPASIEFVASPGDKESGLRSPPGIHRIVVPRDSVALVYKVGASGSSTKTVIIAAATVLVFAICVDRARHDRLGKIGDFPKLFP
jgi:hypothetical protein